MDVIVVGGGIIGSAVTYRLAEAGANVTLLEAGAVGSGASAVGYGWLNASYKPPFSYHYLNVRGIGEYQTLGRELGNASWLHMDGHIRWNSQPDGPEQVRKSVERLQSLGYPAEILPINELEAIEPDLVAPSNLEEFAYYPMEGYLDPVYCMGALLAGARSRGAIVRTHTPVVDFIKDGDRVAGVVTDSGERLYADMVVTCTGRWTEDLAQHAGVHVPLKPDTGMIAFSSPTAARLRSLLHSDIVNIRPDGAGRVLMRHRDFDAKSSVDMQLNPVPSFTDELLARVAEILPSMQGARVESIRVALRPIPRDGHPVIGRAPGVNGLYVIATHSGVTLGALFGRIASREILTDVNDSTISDFRPDRFTAATTSA